MDTHSRFYKNKLPKVDSYVMARIIKVDDEGAECQLMEYDNIPAYMPISQFSSKRLRSIRQVAKAGSEEILRVFNIDQRTGAVDLSKKTLTEEDITKASLWYRKSRKWHNIMKRIAEKCGTEVQAVYLSFGWDIYLKLAPKSDTGDVEAEVNDTGAEVNETGDVEDKVTKAEELVEPDKSADESSTESDESNELDDNIIVPHPIDLIEKSLQDPLFWDQYIIPDNMKGELIEVIHRRYQLTTKKYEMEMSITCYGEEGIDTLISVFKQLETDHPETKITIKSSPIYLVSILNLDPEYAINTLNETANTAKRLIESFGGEFSIVKEPQCVCE